MKRLEFFGAFEESQLRGVLETNEKHRQSIGRMLLEYLKRNSKSTIFTVHSSPYAVPVYHKFGFVDTDSKQISDGIRFTPMKFER